MAVTATRGKPAPAKGPVSSEPSVGRVGPLRVAARALGLSVILGGMVLASVAAGEPSIFGLAFLVPGLVLLLRRDWHVIGWALCAMALGQATVFASDWEGYEVTAPFGIPQAWWEWWEGLFFYGGAFWGPFLVLLGLFPDGLAGQPVRHVRYTRTTFGIVGLMFLSATLIDKVTVGGELVASPTGVGFVPSDLVQLQIAVLLPLVLGAALLLVLRSRRVHGAARRQHRWVLFALGVILVPVPMAIAVQELTGSTVGWNPVLLGYLLLPVAFMVAILRYRLYDIDRIVSRSVTYTVVVVVLGVVYAGLVVALRSLLPVEGDVPVAMSTLVVALAFLPLVRRVQRVVDRRFFRSRYDAGVVVARVANELRGSLDLAEVTGRVGSVVEEVFAPETVGVWVAGEPSPSG